VTGATLRGGVVTRTGAPAPLPYRTRGPGALFFALSGYCAGVSEASGCSCGTSAMSRRMGHSLLHYYLDFATVRVPDDRLTRPLAEMHAHLRSQSVGCSPKKSRSRRISSPATRLFGAARSRSYSHESMVYGKGKFSELRLEGTLPSPVIERLGKVTVSVAESGTVVGVGASRHTCGGCACVYLLFLLRRKNCRLDLASAPSEGPGRNAPALC
jgi:hypothetical protein